MQTVGQEQWCTQQADGCTTCCSETVAAKCKCSNSPGPHLHVDDSSLVELPSFNWLLVLHVQYKRRGRNQIQQVLVLVCACAWSCKHCSKNQPLHPMPLNCLFGSKAVTKPVGVLTERWQFLQVKFKSVTRSSQRTWEANLPSRVELPSVNVHSKFPLGSFDKLTTCETSSHHAAQAQQQRVHRQHALLQQGAPVKTMQL